MSMTYYITGSAPDVRKRLRALLFRDPTQGIVSATLTLIVISDVPMRGTPEQLAATMERTITKEFDLKNVTVRAVASE